jgi:CubicO group peptidase (beta-lactamase class C family)
MRTALALATAALLAALVPTPRPVAQTAPGQPPALDADLRGQIDRIAGDVLESTAVPSASLAIVRGGAVAYAQAYGHARTEPPLKATPSMRYSIGSISKQFTAAAILLLQEQGRLSLDDAVGKFVPGLTRGDEVTIRQVLSHTSGYQDYWPQDYMPPMMLRPTTSQAILDRWAKRPLDFDPGTKWQYSNTNYVIAGLIVERAGGAPLWTLLEQRVFTPLGMSSVTNTDEAPLPDRDPRGYFRYALGPERPAPKEGRGWLFAAGELAMTASDLGRWNQSMIRGAVLQPASYREMETAVTQANGVGTAYGLGVRVTTLNGHRELEHNGEVMGFTAENIVLPDDGLAVSVLTNQDAVSAAGDIGRRVARALLAQTSPHDEQQIARARQVFDALREGKIDRSLFTENANSYFTEQALRDYRDSLAPLGKVESFTQSSQGLRGGMTYRNIDVKCGTRPVSVSIYEMPDGRFEQFLVAPQ